MGILLVRRREESCAYTAAGGVLTEPWAVRSKFDALYPPSRSGATSASGYEFTAATRWRHVGRSGCCSANRGRSADGSGDRGAAIIVRWWIPMTVLWLAKLNGKIGGEYASSS